MRVLGLDLETTGLDTNKDQITEIGLVLWETDGNHVLGMWSFFLKDPDEQSLLNKDCIEKNGITQKMLDEFGSTPKSILAWLDGVCLKYKVEYLVSHNAENFDKPFLLSQLDWHGVVTASLRKLPWVDTRWDIPFKKEPEMRKLTWLGAEHGVLNLFPHRAVFDVLTMLKVMSFYDFEEILNYRNEPWIYVRAFVHFDNREQAKRRGFVWQEIGKKSFPKMWVKRIKQNKLIDEKNNCPFQVEVIDEAAQ